MQVADGRTRTLRLDEQRDEPPDQPDQGWRVRHLQERIEALEARNGLLRGRLNDARDRAAQLERKNRFLREELMRLTSGSDG